MENNRKQRVDEDPLAGQARQNVRRTPPLLPVLCDRSHEEFGIDSQQSAVSQLSFSSESSDSGSSVLRPLSASVEPIVELPSTPPREPVDSKIRFQSLDPVLTPESIGEALERSGTVLMQRSRENRLAKQLEEMQALMESEDDLVVLKQPSHTVHQMQSQPAFTQDVMRDFLEHSETMFQLVHDTTAGASSEAKDAAGGEETAGRAPPPSAPSRRDAVGGKDEFVGCFSKDNDMVLYRRTVDSLPKEGERRESIDALIAQHAKCLAEADELREPDVQIYQANDENMLALLTFSEHSSAVLKTSNATVEDVNSYEDLNRVLLQTYRQLINRPDEMISMKTQRPKAEPTETERTHIHRSRVVLPARSGSNGTASFGLSNASRSGVTLQGSSKNWSKCRSARNAAGIVTNLRLMLEEFILREIPASAGVLQFLARLFADIVNCPPAEVDKAFYRAPLVDKIKRVIDELLMPHDLEDPLVMVNQAKLTMEQILASRFQAPTAQDGATAWSIIFATSMRLVCELDHDIEDPDAFIEALQYGIRSVLGPEDSMKLFERKPAPTDRAAAERSGTSQAVQPVQPGGVGQTQPSQPAEACHCFTSWVLLYLGLGTVWLKEQLINLWTFLNTTPPILSEPSVSFRATVTDEERRMVEEVHVQRDQHSETVDVLRSVLQQTPSVLSTAREDPSTVPSVNDRSVQLVVQLLQHSRSIVLRHSSSQHNIHLQLRQDGLSGDLQKRQSDELLMLTGNIRDHAGNVAVCFEARMFDLDSVEQNESAIEYVTRVERLSDDKDGDDHDDVHDDDDGDDVEEPDDANEETLMMNAVLDDLITVDRLEAAEGRQDHAIGDALGTEIKNYLQGLLAPVLDAVHAIHGRIVQREDGIDVSPHNVRSSKIDLDSDAPDIVHEVGEKLSEADADNSIYKTGQTRHKDFSLEESLQELVSMFHDANDRLAMIDCDVTTIRNQVQQLVAEQLQQLELLQQQQQKQKISQGDGYRSAKRRSSARNAKRPPASEEQKNVCNYTACCPIGQYSPVELYSCHGVSQDVLVVHWKVDEAVLECISGYEIYVDGVLRSVCFSNKRRTALISGINLRQSHQLALHATPDNRYANSVRWAPAIFLYHL